MPERQPNPMSVVPPSPPMAITRVSAPPDFFAFTLKAAAMPVATAAVLPKREWNQGSCQLVSG